MPANCPAARSGAQGRDGRHIVGHQLGPDHGRVGLTCDNGEHGPNWSAPTDEAFQERVREAMAAAPGGWIIDGNYDAKLGDTVVGVADTIVWLDLPSWIKLRRLWSRTMHRIAHDVELWNGNRETWRGAFLDHDALFTWMIRSHVRHRRQWPERFGHDPRFVRLRSDAAVSRWLDDQAAS